MENPIKMDDLGENPPFKETPKWRFFRSGFLTCVENPVLREPASLGSLVSWEFSKLRTAVPRKQQNAPEKNRPKLNNQQERICTCHLPLPPIFRGKLEGLESFSPLFLTLTDEWPWPAVKNPANISFLMSASYKDAASYSCLWKYLHVKQKTVQMAIICIRHVWFGPNTCLKQTWFVPNMPNPVL